MAQAQAIPKPPPGFVIQGAEEPPAPPMGFVLDTEQAPPPPPGFILDSQAPEPGLPLEDKPAKPQPGPQVFTAASTPSAVLPAQDVLRTPHSAPPPPPGFVVLEPEATPVPGAQTPAVEAIPGFALERTSELPPVPGPTFAPDVMEAARIYGVSPEPGESEEGLRRRIYEAQDAISDTGQPVPPLPFDRPPEQKDERSFLGRYADATWRASDKAAEGLVEGLELDRPLGMTPETRGEAKELVGLDGKDGGFLNAVLDPARRAAMATLETGSVVGDLLFRPVNSALNAGIKGTVETGRNLGLSESSADSLERELNKLVMLGGVYAAGVAPGAVVRTPRMQARTGRPAPIRKSERETQNDRFQRLANRDQQYRSYVRDRQAMQKELARLEKEGSPATEETRATLRGQIKEYENAELGRYIELRNQHFMQEMEKGRKKRLKEQGPRAAGQPDEAAGRQAMQRQRDMVDREIASLQYDARFKPETRQRLDVLKSQRAMLDNMLDRADELTPPPRAATAAEPPPGPVRNKPATGETQPGNGLKQLFALRNIAARELASLEFHMKKAGASASARARISELEAEINDLDGRILTDGTLPQSARESILENRRLRGLPDIEAPTPPPGFVLDDAPPPRTTPDTDAREFERQRLDEEIDAIPPEIRQDVETGRLPELREELRQLGDAGEAEVQQYRQELQSRIAAMENAQAALNRRRMLDEPEQLGLFDEQRLRTQARQAAAKHGQGLPPDRRRQLMQQAEEAVITDAQTAALASAQEKIGSKTAGQVVKGTRQEWIERTTQRMQQELFDALRPIKHLAERVGREKGEAPDLKPYREMRLVAGVQGVMEAAHRRGSLKLNPDGSIGFAGPSLNEAFAPIADNVEHGLLYFVGRRAKELDARGIKTPFTKDEIFAMLDIGRTYPAAVKAFQNWRRYNKEMLDFLEQAGVLDEATKGKFIELGKDYVPFHRWADPDPLDVRPDTTSLFERIKGGDANIREVLENISYRTNTMIDMAVRNLAKQQVYRFIDKNGLDDIAQPVETLKTRRLDAATERMVKQAEESLKMADLETAAMLDTAVSPEMQQLLRNMGLTEDGPLTKVLSYNRPVSDSVDFVYENGKRKVYLLKDPQFATAMHAFTPKAWEMNNALFGISKRAANLLRRGATLEPGFIIKNITRDAQVAYIQGNASFVPIIDTIRGLNDRLIGDDNYWKMLANGGGWASRFKGEITNNADLQELYRMSGIDAARVLDSPEKLVNALKEANAWAATKTAGRNVKRLGRRALDAAETASSSFETANRLAEFRGVANATGDIREAAFRAREVSTDFGLRGSNPAVRFLTAIIPFSNARIQGLEKSVRAFRENPARVARRTAMLITVPSLALHAMNRNDNRYRQMPDYIRDQHWIVFAGEEEDAPYFLIPKGHEFGAMFGTLPERIFDAIEQANGKQFADALGRVFLDTVSVGGYPQIIKPVDDVLRNKSFTGAPIVNQRLQKVKPEEQFDEGTSATMRALGKAIGVSPKKLEYLFRGYLGTLGLHALTAADVATRKVTGESAPAMRLDEVPVSGRFAREQPLRHTQYERDIYELRDASETVNATVSKMIAEGREPEVRERDEDLAGMRDMLRDVTSIAADISREITLIALDRSMTGAQKQKEIRALRKAKNDLFREAASAVPPKISRQFGHVRPVEQEARP